MYFKFVRLILLRIKIYMIIIEFLTRQYSAIK